jgi:diamine N-acetyltransferase
VTDEVPVPAGDAAAPHRPVTPTDASADALAEWAARREAAGEAPSLVPDRPRSVRDGAVVELREVTGETVRAICRLVVAPAQRGFVAPNAVSFAEALFEPKAWYRAIYADDRPVGFVMLHDDPEAQDGPSYYLWRLMIADGYQGLGYGRRAVELVIDHVRTRPGATTLAVSWVPAPGGPGPFYLGLGFELTGEVDEGEVVARLRL